MKTFSKVPGKQEIVEPVSCPICSEQKVKGYWDCDTFKFSQCVRCGHVYQNPRPKSEDLLGRYDGEYLDYEVANDQQFFELMKLGLQDVRIDDLESSIRASSNERPRLLDIGCATGMLVQYFQRRGWEAQGVEVCVPAAQYGINNRGVDIKIGTLESVGYPSGYFDIVHSSHVIEHVPEPGEFLAEQTRVLRPGGYLIVTTPNRASLQAVIRGSEWRSAIADHVHLFSKKNLMLMLKNVGLSPQAWKTWGGIPRGAAPVLVKNWVDSLVKIIGIGDVMIILAQKLKT